jgi:hypothetical protein
MIKLDSIHSTNTYAGCYEGRPSPEELLDNVPREAFKLFGERAIYIVEPVITDGKLPPCRHVLWLHNEKPIPTKDGEEEAHGSELLLVYYNNTLQSDHSMLIKSFNENIEEWNGLAGNFWY